MYAKYPLGQPLKICEFPFINDDLVFTLILPNKNSLALIESQLTAAFFDKLIEEMRPVTINAILPEFSIHNRVDVRDVLRRLGATETCDLNARNDGLFVSHAFYDSAISIGSKLARLHHHNTFAMTRHVIESVDSGCDQLKKTSECENADDDKLEVCCDSPFVFFIRNRRSKLIHCMGKLVTPI